MILPPRFGSAPMFVFILSLLIQYPGIADDITFAAVAQLRISAFNSWGVNLTQTCITSGPAVTVK